MHKALGNLLRWLSKSWWLSALVIMSLLAPLLSNSKPLICRYNKEWYLPALTHSFDKQRFYRADHPLRNIALENNWKSASYDFSIFPLIPFDATDRDTKHQKISPFAQGQAMRWRHWLGTDAAGHDVLAGLISGTKVAVWVGFLALLAASILGIGLGLIAGYFGDRGLNIKRWHLIVTLPVLVLLPICIYLSEHYTASHAPSVWWLFSRFAIVVLAVVIVAFGKFLLPAKSWLYNTVTIPIDLILMRLSEVTNSFPKLIILTAIIISLNSAPSLTFIAIVAGLVSWPIIAAFVRAELLRIRELGYIAAAKVSGIPEWKIMLKHALPNAMPAAYVAMALFAGHAILLETSLSFLGFRTDSEVISWGTLMLDARLYPMAWWLAIFPGLMITLTIYALYRLTMQAPKLHTQL